MAREGYRQSMEILLREKVLTKKKRERLINSFDKNRIAPLHYAARYDHVDIMELLIAHGANVDIKDKEEGLTPLHFCARYSKHEKVGLRLRETRLQALSVRVPRAHAT